MPPDHAQILGNLWRCYQEQCVIADEQVRQVGAPGQPMHIHVRYAYMPPDTVVVQAEDLTERVVAQQALQESERRLATLMSNLPGMAYRCANAPDWRMMFVSQGAQGLTGYCPQALMGASGSAYGDLIHPADREMVWQTVQRAVKQHTPFQATYRIQTAEDQIKWVWEQGRGIYDDDELVALEGFMIDITHRRAAEDALRASEARYRTLVEMSPDAVVVTDLDATITMANPRALEMHGSSHIEDLVGRNAYELLAAEDHERFVAAITQALDERTHFSGEYALVHPDGSAYPGELSVTVLTHAGEPTGFIATARDLTERKRLQEQLRRSQRLESIGRLAGGIAHDFNNLLTVINGYSELLIDSLNPSDPLREEAAEILEAGQRGSRLTRQLLAFSRQQLLDIQTLDLNTIVSDMLGMLKRLISEHIELEVRLAEGQTLVKADQGQIEQALTNLVTNARDAMPTGGVITLETGHVHLDAPQPTHREKIPPGEYSTLTVCDTGQGVPQEILEHLFEPFFTTKDVGQGTGLGLATVYGIVKQLQGYIDLQSSREQGTSFCVYLPRARSEGDEVKTRDDAPADAALNEGASCQSGSSGDTEPLARDTILLIEDEDGVRNLVARLLEDLGYGVLTAASGVEALEEYEDSLAQVALVLTDVVMPQMSGRDVAQALCEAGHGIPILYMSGHTEDIISHHGVLDQEIALIHKPFTGEELGQKIDATLNHVASISAGD
jgi:PAS domain S-box-containing protein